MKIHFAGDAYFGETAPDRFLDDDLRRLFAESALVSVNFEAPVAEADDPPLPKAGAHWRHSADALDLLRREGVGALSLANNHIYDYADAGLARTLEAARDFATVGAGMTREEAYRPRIVDLEGTRVGLVSYCEGEFGVLKERGGGRGGFAWICAPEVESIVSRLAEETDVVVAQAHCGVEETDVPLPEWRERFRALIDAGADAIVGHHPHTPRGVEVYRGKPIFYSLGNLFFNAPALKRLNRGLVAELEIVDRRLAGFRAVPVEFGELVSIWKEGERETARLSAALEGEGYRRDVDRLVLELWRDRYETYYAAASAGAGERRSILRALKAITTTLLGGERATRKRRLLLLHNLRIESHRWATERALSLLEESDRER